MSKEKKIKNIHAKVFGGGKGPSGATGIHQVLWWRGHSLEIAQFSQGSAGQALSQHPNVFVALSALGLGRIGFSHPSETVSLGASPLPTPQPGRRTSAHVLLPHHRQHPVSPPAEETRTGVTPAFLQMTT